MNREIKSSVLAVKLWLSSAISLATGVSIYLLIKDYYSEFYIFPLSFIASIIGSIPAFIALLIFQPLIKKGFHSYSNRIAALLIIFSLIALAYGLFAAFVLENSLSEYASFQNFFLTAGICIASVFAATFIAYLININNIRIYFLSPVKKIFIMKENFSRPFAQSNQTTHPNRLWIKGLITAGLILLMLIPTAFIYNLVEERQARQKEVKDEVSSKWAGEQNITSPYLYIPYNISVTGTDGKTRPEERSFIILPENLTVNGTVSTEERKRSIYRVLLYNSLLNAKGNFTIQIPGGIDSASINWQGSKICFGISDFKGIQQKITTRFNNINYDLSAGLPTNKLDTNGLSSPVILTADNIGKEISFELPLKIKGTDKLHFSPLAGNSNFTLKSSWSSPSFDGNTLPGERSLNNNGFEANWNFNKANLPFNTSLKDFNFKKDDYSFGVSLIQPADQYAKTMRSVKYAILFIGLTFSLFFIVEVMQKKPFHPLQYVLVGLALVIFFTLLLSISEFLLFDTAYLIASVATVSLITLYAKSHFRSWSIAGVFAAVIGCIYAFIFVLIRLEDTALLVGSIGLFIILALAMYASRKINWYGNNPNDDIAV